MNLEIHPIAVAHIFGITASFTYLVFFYRRRWMTAFANIILSIILLSLAFIVFMVVLAQLTTGFSPWNVRGSEVAIRNSALLPAMWVPLIIVAKFLKNRKPSSPLLRDVIIAYMIWGIIYSVILFSASKIQQ